ncbi:MAG: phosphoribosylformylglycinamidine synthase subunit PurQ [Deltaproteobacteria bacterium]|nr:phosphoribosylformylglycinamidine synthase subunit PurQ [Deltaproteobacteria bacterium]
MKFGIVVFPGSNCDHDCYHVVKNVLGQEAEYIWHKETQINGFDCLILPGGFSYGDYLRTGAIAMFSPVMKEVKEFADEGGLVIGICNGFQILVEAGLLPGVLMRNKDLKFICENRYIRVESNDFPFTRLYKKGEVVRMPIAHADGNYFADDETLKRIQDNGQIIFRYCDADGNITENANPNGSLLNIAGICNEKRNVLGIMPHPERCAEDILGNVDGKRFFESVLSSF